MFGDGTKASTPALAFESARPTGPGARLYAYAVFATRPLASTNQRSLAKGLPERRAFIQSAAKTEGVGPRLVDGTLPTEWRESWYTTSCLGHCRVLNRRSVCSSGESSSASPAMHRYGTRIFSACSSQVRSEEHTSELQSRLHLVCRLLLEKKKKN